MQTPQVSMVIDNRSNKECDFREAMAVTATGKVGEIVGPERERFETLYLKKHPALVDFTHSPAYALLKIEVETYYIVRQFQQVSLFSGLMRYFLDKSPRCGYIELDENARPERK
jgi:hypothetical protein